MSLNHHSLPLWQTALEEAQPAGTPQCCVRPSTPDVAPLDPAGVAFTGFGHVKPDLPAQLNLTSLEFPLTLSTEMRTFAARCVLWLWSNASDPQLYFGVFLEDGRLSIQGTLPTLENAEQTRPLSLASESAYNNGEWFKVSKLSGKRPGKCPGKLDS